MIVENVQKGNAVHEIIHFQIATLGFLTKSVRDIGGELLWD